jgi:hypothetical protein
MKQNIYLFKVKFYDNDGELWYPPIEARAYKQALYTLASDRNVDTVTLKCIQCADGRVITSPITDPAAYDIKG